MGFAAGTACVARSRRSGPRVFFSSPQDAASMEGIKTVNAKMAAYLHPSRAADVPQGVHEMLNSLLLRFNEEFEGVILAYLAPKILGRTAKILSGLYPYFHVNLTAKLLLFSPAPGMKIEGKVNMIEKDYIGVLVLGLFNTTIGVVDIRNDLDYIASYHSGRAWVSNSDQRHAIELGSLIRFSVKSLQETEHIIDICGSLVEDDTGCVDWLERSPSSSKSKGYKEDKQRSSEHEERKHKKKLKKDRVQHDVQDLEKHPQELEHSHASLKNEKVKGGIEEPLVVPRHKKRKEMDPGQSPQESNHKFKRKKGEALHSK